jgi:imidazolonepropionase-like amidohydrolase
VAAVPAGPATALTTHFDLVVRGATLVGSGHQETTDIGVRDGRVAQLGGRMTGERELQAGGLLALPGGIDAHVHLMYQCGPGTQAGRDTRLRHPTLVRGVPALRSAISRP